MPRDELGERIQTFINANGGARLIVGALFILGLQLVMLFNWLSEKTEERAIDLAVLRSEVAGMRGLLEAQDLDAVLAEAQRLNDEFARKSHQSSSAGLAAADIRGYISQSARALAVSNLEIVVNVDGDSNADIFRYVVDVNGVEAAPGEFAVFLAKIMSGEVEYEAETIFWERRSGRFRMRLACVGRFVEER